MRNRQRPLCLGAEAIPRQRPRQHHQAARRCKHRARPAGFNVGFAISDHGRRLVQQNISSGFVHHPTSDQRSQSTL